MKFTLPLPPGINSTYGISKNRHMYKKEIARSWEQDVGWIIHLVNLDKRLEEPTGDIVVEIKWYVKRPRDIDAGIKILLDIFQKQGVYENDKQVKELHVYNRVDKERPRVEVSIENLNTSFIAQDVQLKQLGI